MTFLDSLSEKIRNDDPLPWYLDAALSAAIPLYRTGMMLRAMQTPVKVNARVISFGNLTTGGTGKTPAVIERADAEIAAGNRVAVLTRGYGATQRLDEIVCVEGSEARGMADVIGDEPALIARRVPGALIARNADRVATARKAVAEFGCNVLILDDGFQYLRLARDVNVLIVDASNPFGNAHLLPRGTLREPIGSAARATTIILTHCDRVDTDRLRELEGHLGVICPGVAMRKTCHAPASLWSVENGNELSLETLRAKTVAAVCAIARPESFVATLERLGARVVEKRFFPDHARIPGEALRSRNTIVTTEKDAARMTKAPANVFALGVRLSDFTF